MNKLREWINRDDGKFYQIGNENLNVIEIIGYFLLVLSLVLYGLHQKAGLEATWIGWVSFLVGVVMVFYGGLKKEGSNEST